MQLYNQDYLMGTCCYSEGARTDFQRKLDGTTKIADQTEIKDKKSSIERTADTKEEKPIDYQKEELLPQAIPTKPVLEIKLEPILTEEKRMSSQRKSASVSYSGVNYSKLNRERHFFNVFNPSISNSSVVKRLQLEEPNDSLFQGIPVFSKFSAASNQQPSGYKERPSTEDPEKKSVFVPGLNSVVK